MSKCNNPPPQFNQGGGLQLKLFAIYGNAAISSDQFPSSELEDTASVFFIVAVNDVIKKRRLHQ